MKTLNSRRESAIRLDIEKKKLEASITVKISQVFKNMANDASNLYLATGTLNSELLSKNYSPEFLKEVRDAMRKSIKSFGFKLRKDIELKHDLYFNIREIKKLISEVKIIIQDDNLSEKIREINNKFLLASSLFISNESEKQNDYITNTNQEMLTNALIKADVDFTQNLQESQTLLFGLEERLPSLPIEERTVISRQIINIRNQIAISNNNKSAIIAENIRTNLLLKSPARSELISSQNVGLAESWSRQTEAELIDEAKLVGKNGVIEVTKEWFAILDKHTRSAHAEADGQVVGVNEFYNVWGEDLKYPRDPNASAKNIMNCRCISNFGV